MKIDTTLLEKHATSTITELRALFREHDFSAQVSRYNPWSAKMRCISGLKSIFFRLGMSRWVCLQVRARSSIILPTLLCVPLKKPRKSYCRNCDGDTFSPFALRNNKSKRDVPLNDTAIQAIKEMREEIYLGEDFPLIPDISGEHLNPERFRRRYYRLLDGQGWSIVVCTHYVTLSPPTS